VTRGTSQEKPYIHPLLSRAREETSLLGFLNVLLRHRRVIAATALLGTAVCLVSALMEPRYYSTHVLFTARSAQSSPLGGIAAQFGLTIVGDDPTQSIEFYEDLLKSTELLRRVAAHEYRVRTSITVPASSDSIARPSEHPGRCANRSSVRRSVCNSDMVL